MYSFKAEANDNKARFRCEASNIMSQTPLKAEMDLTVLCNFQFLFLFYSISSHIIFYTTTTNNLFSVAPTHVSISGPSEARIGDSVPLTCATAPSNPPAEIKWSVNSRQIRNSTSKTVVSPEGKFILLVIQIQIIQTKKIERLFFI